MALCRERTRFDSGLLVSLSQGEGALPPAAMVWWLQRCLLGLRLQLRWKALALDSRTLSQKRVRQQCLETQMAVCVDHLLRLKPEQQLFVQSMENA